MSSQEATGSQEATVEVTRVGIDKIGDVLYRYASDTVLLNKAPPIPFMLIGDPGIGKSDIVRQVARRLAHSTNREFVELTNDTIKEVMASPDKYVVLMDLRLTEVSPEDLGGIPKLGTEYASRLPYSWAYVLSRPNVIGVLFLDELTNVQDMGVVAAAYKILLDRAAGDVQFSRGVMVVAAGNPPSVSSIATRLPAPLINRMAIIHVESPGNDVKGVTKWIKFMDDTFGDDWDKSVGTFLLAYPSMLYEKGEVISVRVRAFTNFATPRGWTKLATLPRSMWDPGAGSSSIDFNTWRAVVAGIVGPRAANMIAAFKSLAIDPSTIVNKLSNGPNDFIDMMTELRKKHVVNGKTVDPNKVVPTMIYIAISTAMSARDQYGQDLSRLIPIIANLTNALDQLKSKHVIDANQSQYMESVFALGLGSSLIKDINLSADSVGLPRDVVDKAVAVLKPYVESGSIYDVISNGASRFSE